MNNTENGKAILEFGDLSMFYGAILELCTTLQRASRDLENTLGSEHDVSGTAALLGQLLEEFGKALFKEEENK